ncbi:MAG: hypothetical protein HYU66_07195 [Armatimonadetes bacterium]|nr:hypothetical protein [Armatimonadota bacterium]
MRLAVLSESIADEAALRAMVGAVLGAGIDWANHPYRLPSRGWHAVVDNLKPMAVAMHYRTNADGLVVVADADLPAVPHGASRSSRIPRLEQLRQLREAVCKQLRPRRGRAPMRIMVGVAVPAIEAWYLCGRDGRATEAAFLQGHWDEQGSELRAELKRLTYGTTTPSLAEETAQATADAERLARNIARLEGAFPQGFGSLAEERRSWSDA